MKNVSRLFLFASVLALVLNSCRLARNTTFVAIDSGYDHTCVLTKAGGVICWGDGITTPTEITGLTSGVKAISAGFNHTCALTFTGGVKCWQGGNSQDFGIDLQLAGPIPEDVIGLTSGVTAISAGGFHTCALTSSGGVKCWGANAVGQLGNGSTSQFVATPADVVGLASGVSAISAGSEHTCALTVDGAVKCWGFNSYGALGDGTTTGSATPVNVVGLVSGVSAISAGGEHTCALTSTGEVKCWGYNTGQDDHQSDGMNDEFSAIPVDVIGLTKGATAISVGGGHNCALTGQGEVKCWGLNRSGELGDGTTTDSIAPVTGSGLKRGISGIAAGEAHTCALTVDDRVKCWGWNGFGQLGDGTVTDSSKPVDVIECPGPCQ